MEPGKIYILHDIGKTELTPEEAKEHLSDTELPPNMKKIIEGVGKMSESEKNEKINQIHEMMREVIGEDCVIVPLKEWNREAIGYRAVKDNNETHKGALIAARKYIDGTAVLFSHRTKEAVLSQLDKALQQIRE